MSLSAVINLVQLNFIHFTYYYVLSYVLHQQIFLCKRKKKPINLINYIFNLKITMANAFLHIF